MKYIAYASYVVKLKVLIEADNENEAHEKALILDTDDFTEFDYDGWQIDKVALEQ